MRDDFMCLKSYSSAKRRNSAEMKVLLSLQTSMVVLGVELTFEAIDSITCVFRRQAINLEGTAQIAVLTTE
jgi:hypothetical protein